MLNGGIPDLRWTGLRLDPRLRRPRRGRFMVRRTRYADDESGQFVDIWLLTRDTRHILGP